MSIYEIDLQQFKYAIALYDQQGITRTAEYLNIDRGFLSREITSLEKRLEFQVFKTRTSPVKLTDAGNEFLTVARHIINQFEQQFELCQQLDRAEKERINIGINISMSNSLLPRIIRKFNQQFPAGKIMLYEMPSYEQIEKLRHQEIDLGFFHRHNLENTQRNNDIFDCKSILKEKLVIVLPENHRFAKQTSISLKTLANEQFILPPEHLLNSLRKQINSLCQEAGFPPKVRQEAAWMSTILSLVAGEMGISLLPANVENLGRNGVVYRDIQEQSPILEIVAVWRKDNESVVLQNFLQGIEDV
ncbi:LysR substrate-binding domain-containing protein [Nostoc sp. TCL26-01]|uniref:LysR substrate-binding domain-containing protein n=1 Tax=Nostoc sp. TCL26-01 TaxID=2576904 RepID=UPI0015C0ADB3|nr:LysR substrate-binding domain-containing protein [Nostoc sp. TCL26-01]QLE55172.1 LysR family transcriptional regulator [Nostoc sp. TCL26-01]